MICSIGVVFAEVHPLVNQSEIAIYDPHETINSTATHCSVVLFLSPVFLNYIYTTRTKSTLRYGSKVQNSSALFGQWPPTFEVVPRPLNTVAFDNVRTQKSF